MANITSRRGCAVYQYISAPYVERGWRTEAGKAGSVLEARGLLSKTTEVG